MSYFVAFFVRMTVKDLGYHHLPEVGLKNGHKIVRCPLFYHFYTSVMISLNIRRV